MNGNTSNVIVTLSGDLAPFTEESIKKIKEQITPQLWFAGSLIDGELLRSSERTGKPFYKVYSKTLFYYYPIVPYDVEDYVFYLQMLKDVLPSAQLVATLILPEPGIYRKVLEKSSFSQLITSVELDLLLQIYLYARKHGDPGTAFNLARKTVDVITDLLENELVDSLIIKSDVTTLVNLGILKTLSEKKIFEKTFLLITNYSLMEQAGRLIKIFQYTPPSYFGYVNNFLKTLSNPEELNVGVVPNVLTLDEIVSTLVFFKDYKSTILQLFYPLFFNGFSLLGRVEKQLESLHEQHPQEVITPLTWMNFNTIYIDESKCNLCKKCIDICPYYALQATDNRISVQDEKCVLCNACIEICPQNAIAPSFLCKLQ
ncbi:MAG: hypothetical protein DRJ47_08440 [Thermoprotei archaeon]|nr:MAG: hypothetical protein DRJ47_08440 [Thermoprotei archaeon]